MKTRKPITVVNKAKLRKGHVTASEAEAGKAKQPVKVLVGLDAATTDRLDRMAFKQVQTTTRMESLEKSLTTLMQSVTSMASLVDSHLGRIRSAPTSGEEHLFHHRLFTKVSIKLRKKTIDVTVEDLDKGVRRRRVFRCDNYSKVEHLICARTLIDGIYEVAPRAVRKRKVPKQKVNKPQTIEDIRHEMERDGIKNTVLPMPNGNHLYDAGAAHAQEHQNLMREKAEKVIVKLCSAGGPCCDATDQELIDALQANGFTDNIAFYAAMNCGRITDPKVIKKYEAKPKKSKAQTTSNEY